MKLQGRDLQLNMRGEDVKLLQTELRRLDFTINDVEGFFGAATLRAVERFQRERGMDPVTGIVDEATARLINRAVDELDLEAKVVLGQVRQEDGSPVAGVAVQVFDKGLRTETLLSRALTDAEGRFEVDYAPEIKPLCLILRASDRSGTELAVSEVIFDPKPVETVDLLIGENLRGPSEYSALERKLRPYLVAEGIDPVDLQDEDVVFLARKLGLSVDQIEHYAAAMRLSRQTRLRTEAFYAFFRRGLPIRLSALLAQDPKVLRGALEGAVAENLVSPGLKDEIERIVDRIQDLIVQHAFERPEVNGKFSLNDLFETTRLSRAQREKLLNTYVRREGSVEDFWETLRTDPDFGAKLVEEAQFALQLGAITYNHLPLIRELKRDAGIRAMRDLARLDESDWLELIRRRGADGAIVGTPPEMAGEDDLQKQENYAQVISAIVEDAFPTAFVAERLAKDDDFTLPGKRNLVTFFENNPDFAFERPNTDIDEYLREHAGTALMGISDEQSLRTNLAGMKRLFPITPGNKRYEVLKPLLEEGATSAGTIARMGSGFVTRFTERIGEGQARAVLDHASRRSALAQTLFTQFSPAFLYGTPAAVLSLEALKALPTVPQIPNWETLFGSLALCACDHCESIYSPAAYLVDILAFLKDHGVSSLLLSNSRRSDIAQIELSCQNSHTPLPYIDLVNEILGRRVVSPGQAYQTTGTAEELRAAPAHRNPDAETELATSVFPWSLPFNLPHEEARSYLEHLGIPLYQLMETFQQTGAVSGAEAVAAEHLGLTPMDRAIITGATLEPQQELLNFWAGPGQFNDINQLRTHINRVSNFLDHTGLTYQEVLELISTRFINPFGNLRIEFDDLSCDLEKAQFSPLLSENRLNAIHRFERLRRKLGWSYFDLDRAITALQPGVLNDALLLRLADVERLRTALKLPLTTFLSWWAPLDTWDYGLEGASESLSLYSELFQNKIALDEDRLELFRLNPAGTELLNENEDLKDHLPSLAAVLLAATEDILEIARRLPPKLTLQNLSRLYRTVSLAKALKLSIREYLSLRSQSEIDPFENPARARRFVDVVIKVKAAGFGIFELEYLLWHSEYPGHKLSPPLENIALVLREIHQGLKKIGDETEPAPDPGGELTKEKLAIAAPLLAWEDDETERAYAILNGSAHFTAPLASLPAISFPEGINISFDETEESLHFSGVMTQDEQATLLALAGDADYQTAVESLFQAPRAFVADTLGAFLDPTDFTTQFLDQATTNEQKFEHVLPLLLTFLHHALSEGLVIQRLGEALGLEAKAVRLLLSHLVSPDDPAISSMAAFLALAEGEEPSFPESTEQKEVFRTQFELQLRSFTLLHKVATILVRLEISAKEIPWLVEHAAELDLLDFNTLPSAALGEVLPSLFPDLERLIDLIQLRDNVPPGEPHLFELLDLALHLDEQTVNAAEVELEFLAGLHSRTGWNLSDLNFLASPAGLNQSFPDDYRTGNALRRFQACFKTIKLLGMDAVEIMGWITPTLSFETAQSLKSAAKAKYDNKQWLNIAQAINDVLREKQRNALVAFLIAHREFRSKTHLYDHFLIDPEMSACMMTSRIVQASASVQLYVQRILLGLEHGISLDDAAAEEWEWMKQYRVWEANRKVFLYPENWIEPELRDDKSHLFKELENTLLQGEVTEAAVESALGQYLLGLGEIARLEMSAIYQDRESKILHVFGRTRSEPHRYFYRRRLKGGHWTAWEPMGLDIEGDHLIPIVKNGRLHVYWPIFTENTDEKGTKRREVRLIWSELLNSVWSTPKFAEEVLVLEHYIGGGQLFGTHFRWYRTVLPEGAGGGGTGVSDWEVRKMSSPYLFMRRMIAPDRRQTLGMFDLRDNRIQVIRTYAQFKSEYAHKYSSEDIWAFEKQFGEIQEPIPSFPRGQVNFMAYLEAGNPIGPLELPSGQVDIVGNLTKPPGSILVLGRTPGRFRIAYPHQFNRFVTQAPFFYEDDTYSFLVQPISHLGFTYSPAGYSVPQMHGGWPSPPTHNATPGDVDQVFPMYAGLLHHTTDGPRSTLTSDDPSGSNVDMGALPLVSYAFLLGALQEEKRYQFYSHSHSHVPVFISSLNQQGVSGLLGNLNLQSTGSTTFFSNRYDPVDKRVEPPYPKQEVEFSFTGAYSLYNWELFFHAPFLIAERLRQNQRYAEALRWLQYIFDPMDRSSGKAPQRFWKVRPFFKYDLSDPASQPIQDMMEALSEGNSKLANQVSEWRSNPFRPHAIARLRPIAYQKRVVMAYLDCLIDWADQLFRRDTIESINEATQLYILAAETLGPRPDEIPPQESAPVHTFNELEPQLDTFRNALIEIETKMPGSNGFTLGGSFDLIVKGGSGGSPPPPLTTLYFCIPRNDKLLGYWDTVADRLFKIRHCMNIEGVVRQLPLFAPPIDPALLVQAVAAGLDISSALNDLHAPLPQHRFQVMVQKAVELCNDVKALGAALLSALEKKDAEALSLVRARHEVEVLQAVHQSRERQVEEAREATEALRRTREVIEARHDYYENITQRIPHEDEQLDRMEDARKAEEQALLMDLTASTIANFTPDVSFSVTLGALPSTSLGISHGRANIIGMLQFLSSKRRFDAAKHSSAANKASILGAWDRRSDEWEFQAELASKELAQLDKQITAAEIRLQIAERELETHDRQIANAQEVDAFMRAKYTNKDLYNWMISQISSIYFQSYQLAYDVAKRAERAFQYELGVTDTNFIKFGYWDSLKKGLLAGEKLGLDLKRMDAAYLEQNRREYELTKHISLAMFNPQALLQLKETGHCEIELAEALFDLDYPGHYFRRLKSVSISIPAVTGPYTTLSCTLRLLRSSIRRQNTLSNGQYARIFPSDDPRFSDSFGFIQSIATSSGRNDSGLFELNFRDERYLPFEGAGVISRWQLEMPTEFRLFDYSTISDIVIHLNYTAREGGGALRGQAENELRQLLNELAQEVGNNGLFRALEIKHEFPHEWHQLTQGGETSLTVGVQHLPLFAHGHGPMIEGVTWWARPAGTPPTLEMALNGAAFELHSDPTMPGWYAGPSSLIDLGEAFTLGATGVELEDLVLLMRYRLTG